MKTFIYLLLFLFPFFSGCDLDQPKPSTIVNWEKYHFSEDDAGFLNSFSADGQLQVLSSGRLIKEIFINADDQKSFPLEKYSNAGRFKFPISENFFAYTNKGKVILKSTLARVSESVERILDIKSIDPEFQELIDIPYWQGECMAISADFHLLLAYRAVSGDYTINTPRFLLIGIKPPVDKDEQLEVLETKILDYELFNGMVEVYGIQTFNNQFFIRMGLGMYRISEDGDIIQISDNWLNIFQIGTVLHAFGTSTIEETVNYLQSWDNGESWDLIGEVYEPVLFSLKYSYINGHLIGYDKAQLFALVLNDNSYSISELKNEGLGLADITSLTLANDTTLFITTQCNSFADECGGYFKPLSHFFIHK